MAFRNHLISAGYRAVTQVLIHGEFALRGSLIDVFPMGSNQPLRIDLFDDEIDSIRLFDADTQRSEDTVDHIELLPAREFPLDEDAVSSFRTRYREQFEGDPQKSPVYQSVTDGIPCGGIEYYLPLFFDQTATLFDYIPDNALYCLIEQPLCAAEEYYTSVEQRYEQKKHDLQRPVLPVEALFMSPDSLNDQLSKEQTIDINRFKINESESGTNFNSRAPA